MIGRIQFSFILYLTSHDSEIKYDKIGIGNKAICRNACEEDVTVLKEQHFKNNENGEIERIFILINKINNEVYLKVTSAN